MRDARRYQRTADCQRRRRPERHRGAHGTADRSRFERSRRRSVDVCVEFRFPPRRERCHAVEPGHRRADFRGRCSGHVHRAVGRQRWRAKQRSGSGRNSHQRSADRQRRPRSERSGWIARAIERRGLDGSRRKPADVPVDLEHATRWQLRLYSRIPPSSIPRSSQIFRVLTSRSWS